MLTVIALIFVQQYCRYQRIKRLYRADYARTSYLRSIGKLLPLMPRYKSKRYCSKEELITDSGLGISIEGFYLAKTLMFVLGLVFFVSIQTTNAYMLYENTINDLNIEKSLLDEAVDPDAESLKLEREIFNYFNDCLTSDKVTLKELSGESNAERYRELIKTQIRSHWASIGGKADEIAGRMYYKLIRIRTIEKNCGIYVKALAAAVFLYFVPNLIAGIKLKLIEDKRDWEILNYIYVFSIFGRMPPYNIKNVLSNILVIADIYKPIIAEALNGIKSGNGEAAFAGLLQRVKSEVLYELLEAMRLSMSTGLLKLADNIDEMAANELKWLEIKSIKRRKSKQVIAMIPVVLIMLIAVVYFSYSLSILSNPVNFIK